MLLYIHVCIEHVLFHTCMCRKQYRMLKSICTGLSKAKSDAQKPLSTIDDNTLVVKMPPKMRKRGRPKGTGLTVIGLPNKKGQTTSGPTAFLLKLEWEKIRGKHYTNIYIHATLWFYSKAQLVCRSRSNRMRNMWRRSYTIR